MKSLLITYIIVIPSFIVNILKQYGHSDTNVLN